MRLIEEQATQNELEQQIRAVKMKYDELHDEISMLNVMCDGNKTLKSSSDSLYNAFDETFWKEFVYFVDDFLDIYYPVIDSDSDDFEDAEQKYFDSKEAQNEARKRLLESVFDNEICEEFILSNEQKDREKRLETLRVNK